MAGAVREMIAHERTGYGAQRFLRGRDLHEDVGAVAVFFNHAVDAAYLAFNAAEAAEIGGFDFRVDTDCLASGDRAFASAEGFMLSCCHGSPYASLMLPRRRLLVTTLKELKAMAALASTGLSSSPKTG